MSKVSIQPTSQWANLIAAGPHYVNRIDQTDTHHDIHIIPVIYNCHPAPTQQVIPNHEMSILSNYLLTSVL